MNPRYIGIAIWSAHQEAWMPYVVEIETRAVREALADGHTFEASAQRAAETVAKRLCLTDCNSEMVAIQDDPS